MKKSIFVFLILFLMISSEHVYAQDDYADNLANFTDSVISEIAPDELFDTYEDDTLFSLTGYDSASNLLKAVTQGEYSFDLKMFLKIIFSELLKGFTQYKYIIPQIAFQCVLYSIIEGVGNTYFGDNIKKAAFCAVYVSLTVTVVNVVFNSCKYSTETITKLSDFMNSFITVFFLLIFAGGSSITSAVINPIMLGFASLMSKLILNIIIPVSQAAFLISLSSKVISNIKLTNLKNFVKKSSYFMLGACFSVFGIVISFEGITFSSVDIAGINTVKYAISSLIPVVGKFISESTDVIGGFMLIIKNSIGLVGAVFVCCIVFAPVIKTFALFLIMRGCSIIIEPLCSKNLASSLDESADFLFFINICVLSCSVMMIVLIGILMLIGKNLIPH